MLLPCSSVDTTFTDKFSFDKFFIAINSIMEHVVIECSDQILRRRLAKLHPEVLQKKYTREERVCSLVYKVREGWQYHDIDEEDCGYINFYDEARDRQIFVTSKLVGKSKLFHEEFDIQSYWNVISPCSNHEHSTDMTTHRKEWFLNNVTHVCLQMLDTEGNVAIFCNTGRSRSPMYLVAYLILFCDKTFPVAISHVEDLLLEGRNESLDRHCSLHEIIARVSEIVYKRC